MNGDRDTRGQELSESDGYTRPGQVGDQHFGPVPGDGVTGPAGEFSPNGPADGTRAGGPAGNPANGPASDPPGGWDQTAGATGMTTAADGPAYPGHRSSNRA